MEERIKAVERLETAWREFLLIVAKRLGIIRLLDWLVKVMK